MFKQLPDFVKPRVERIKALHKRIHVLHNRLVKEVKEGIKEGVKEGFKSFIDKDGNTHHTPFTK